MSPESVSRRICTWALLALLGFSLSVGTAAPAALPGTVAAISPSVTGASDPSLAPAFNAGALSTAPAAPDTFAPRAVAPGYTVETVVPGGPNTPSDVTVAADGTIYLAAARSWKVFRVEAGGTVTTTASVGVYTLEMGADGNLYGYFNPGNPAPVYRITTTGSYTTVGTLPTTNCESTLTVGPPPDLDLWIGYNYCGGTSMGEVRIYRMTQAGTVYTVTSGLSFFIAGMSFDNSGRLLMTGGNKLYQVDTTTGALTTLATLPGATESHGLTVDPGGFTYVSSAADSGDLIFRVSPTGTVTTLTTLPAGCAQGLARLPTGDLAVTMRCTGALYRVHPDGTYDMLLPGNGMATPQAMAFSPTGELFVSNDEAGRIVRIVGAHGELFVHALSYTPPLGDLAFLPTGDLYYSEAAPGFSSRLSLIFPDGHDVTVTEDLDFPSGLAFSPVGMLYAVEYMDGEISTVAAGGTVTPFVNGLTRPQMLAADAAGDLYVADYSGSLSDPTNPAEVHPPNRLWRVLSDGTMTVLANQLVQDVVVAPDGTVLISGSACGHSGVLSVASDGTVTPLVCGYSDAVGLAFDLAGNLYVSDDIDNSITRVRGFPQGMIEGNVTGPTGAPVPGATVHVVRGYPVVLGDRFPVEGSGHYFLFAAPGTYMVSVSAPGFCPLLRGDVVVLATQPTQVDFSLRSCGAFLPLVVKGP